MKVLLTGATGFVGSHVLDTLCARDIPTVLLVRRTSNLRWVNDRVGCPHPAVAAVAVAGRWNRAEAKPAMPSPVPASSIEFREGSITDLASLRSALEDVTHVIHCAGMTKARFANDFYNLNQIGTRNLVEAVNARKGAIQKLVAVSSLAAAGPGTPDHPAREDQPPRPVSAYGRSKLAGEEEVTSRCRSEWVIIRPPGVYGPRDEGFFPLFQAVTRHILPCPNARQMMSLVYVKDLAEAIVTAMTSRICSSRAYFVANREVVSGRSMAVEIAAQARTWTVPCPLPLPFLWSACAVRHFASRWSGQAAMLSLHKYPELSAPGWVCDPSSFERDTGFVCATGMRQGIRKTLEWYVQNKWLKP